MRTTALFGKTSYFSNLRCVRMDKVSHYGHFSDKERRFFAILCGHLLWTAPKQEGKNSRSIAPILL